MIFGGRSEIGLELATRLAPGATVVLAARGADRLDTQLAAVRDAGAATVHAVEFDADLAAAAEDHDRPGPRVTHSSRLFTALAWSLMANSTTRLTSDALAFLTERHLAMLTTLRADNSPHVVAVGFTFDPKTHIARVITSDGSQKAINAERSAVGVLSQVDGARWLSLEGAASVNRDPAAVRDAELRYAQRYRTPRANPRRVVIEVHVTRLLGSSSLLDRSKA